MKNTEKEKVTIERSITLLDMKIKYGSLNQWRNAMRDELKQWYPIVLNGAQGNYPNEKGEVTAKIAFHCYREV